MELELIIGFLIILDIRFNSNYQKILQIQLIYVYVMYGVLLVLGYNNS